MRSVCSLIEVKGVRSSCEAMEMKTSRALRLWRRASSVRWRSLMSRAILLAPMMCPALSLMGETDSDTGTSRPSLCTRQVS